MEERWISNKSRDCFWKEQERCLSQEACHCTGKYCLVLSSKILMTCFVGWPGRTSLILGRKALLLAKEGEKANRATEADAVSTEKTIRGKERGERQPRHSRDWRLVENRCWREQLRDPGLVWWANSEKLVHSLWSLWLNRIMGGIMPVIEGILGKDRGNEARRWKWAGFSLTLLSKKTLVREKLGFWQWYLQC